MAAVDFISVKDYLNEVKDDISSPTTSTFVSKMQACKNTTLDLEEVSKLILIPIFKNVILGLRLRSELDLSGEI